VELFWFHQLDTVNMDFLTGSVPFYDGS